MALDFSATYKILVLGDSNVGKTCIVHRFCDERYYDTYISTIGKKKYFLITTKDKGIYNNNLNCLCFILGIDFKQKLINLDGVPIKLQVFEHKIVIMTLSYSIYICCFFYYQIWDTAGQERCVFFIQFQLSFCSICVSTQAIEN